MTDFRHGERECHLARLAYQTFEPLHLVAYFGPAVDAARVRIDAGWLGSYTGMRAAPLGPVPSAVVAATFFGFRPDAVDRAWTRVLTTHTTDELDAIRTETVDTALRACLGELTSAPELDLQAVRMREILGAAGFGGRPLAAAYAALPWPEAPHLALWHATAVWREWRGDGHNAVLVTCGLEPLEALVLYDASLRDVPAHVAAGRGRAMLQPSRRWSDDEWMTAAAALEDRGLVTVSGETTAVTDAGAALRQHIEDATDDAAGAVWVGVPDAENVLGAFRPFSKAVIRSGILPGTTRRE